MNYRADIDGLRSVAVLLVILFHFGIASFPGGYIGVDVFFVLSGFLISSLIFKDLDKNSFSFANFYYRRIKRLAPVYFVVMGSSFVVAYSIMLPSDFKEFGQSLFASTIYLSNVLFYLDSGYFDSASHVKPLLHTWSLSVEEQFYIVFPFLAIVLFKFKRNIVIATIVALSLASLVSAELFIRQDQSAVFYLYPFRAWEMFLGSILALNVIPEPKTKMKSNILSFGGILLIVGAAIFYDHETQFPGITALIPCIGTMALILSGKKGLINQVLSTATPVFIGKLSYSLYLWHWPVFVFFSYYYQHELAGVFPYLLLLVTFILSFISWKFIESPFRSGQARFYSSRFSVFGSTAAVMCVCLAIGFWLHTSNGADSRLSPAEKNFAGAAEKLFETTGKCLPYENEKIPSVSHCAIGNPYRKESYSIVWGDSHAGAYVAPFRKALGNKDGDILIAWAGGCPPVGNLYKKENFSSGIENKNCQKHVDTMLKLIESDAKKINAVIIAGRWSYYLNGGGVGIDSSNKVQIRRASMDIFPKQNEQRLIFLELLEKTLRRISATGVKVYFVEQPPEIENFHARTLAVKLKTGQKDIENIERGIASVSKENVIARQGPVIELASKLEKQGVIEIVSTHEYLCSQANCSAVYSGRPVYFDNNHLSAYAADLTASFFKPTIKLIQGK